MLYLLYYHALCTAGILQHTGPAFHERAVRQLAQGVRREELGRRSRWRKGTRGLYSKQNKNNCVSDFLGTEFMIAMIFCNSWTSAIVEKGKNEKWLSLHGEVWRITTGELKLIDANLNRSKHWCLIHLRFLCEPIVVTIFFLSLKRSTGFLSVSTKA